MYLYLYLFAVIAREKPNECMFLCAVVLALPHEMSLHKIVGFLWAFQIFFFIFIFQTGLAELQWNTLETSVLPKECSPQLSMITDMYQDFLIQATS